MISYLKLGFIFIYTTFCSFLALFSAIFDRSNRSYFLLSKVFSKGVFIISGVRLKISGLDNIDKKKVYVFVSNHSSQFDIPAMQYAVKNRLSIIYKKELSKIPLFGWQMGLGPYIMIDRKKADSAMKSIETAQKSMSEKGMSVLLFAEGTRSKTGEVQPFKRGAFYLAARVGFPIVPVSISGADKILPKGKFKINRGMIYVNFGEPIETGNIKTKADELELMEKVREIVVKNMKKGN